MPQLFFKKKEEGRNNNKIKNWLYGEEPYEMNHQ